MSLSQVFKPTFTHLNNHKFLFTNSLKTNSKTHFFYSIPSKINNLHYPFLGFTRRLFVTSVSGIGDAITGGGGNNNAKEAILAIRREMLLFRQGDVTGSLVEFDKATELDPRQKACRFCLNEVFVYKLGCDLVRLFGCCCSDLWQRGLSLYYLDRYNFWMFCFVGEKCQ